MSFSIEENYATELELRPGKIIHLRKWKVKDRKAFKEIVLEKGDELKAMDIALKLVFPCILEKDILLTDEEIKQITSILRAISIGEEFDFTFYCSNEACQKQSTVKLNITDVSKLKFGEWSEVKIGEDTIEFGEKINPSFYYNTMSALESEEDRALADLAMHILKFNGVDVKTYKDTLEVIENLDTDVSDKIQEEFDKQKSLQDVIHEVQCKHCKNKESFLFDEIPGFFPPSWFK